MRRGCVENFVELDRAVGEETRHDPEREAEIADAVRDEGFDGRIVGRAFLEPETDQQVGRDAHTFPAEEQLQEVVRGHQREHRESEEREIREEPRPVRIFGHVSDRIDVNQERDRVHHHQHDGRERVDAHAPDRREAGNVYEPEKLDDAARLITPNEADKDRPGENERQADRAGRHCHGDLVADVTLQQARERRREERAEDDQGFG